MSSYVLWGVDSNNWQDPPVKIMSGSYVQCADECDRRKWHGNWEGMRILPEGEPYDWVPTKTPAPLSHPANSLTPAQFPADIPIREEGRCLPAR